LGAGSEGFEVVGNGVVGGSGEVGDEVEAGAGVGVVVELVLVADFRGVGGGFGIVVGMNGGGEDGAGGGEPGAGVEDVLGGDEEEEVEED
jgi:hypothetical protein